MCRIVSLREDSVSSRLASGAVRMIAAVLLLSAGACSGTRPAEGTARATAEGGPATAGSRIAAERIVADEGWFARPKIAHPDLPEKITRAFVIPIRDAVSEETLKAVRAGAKRCLAEKVQLVILDVDSFGGQASTALGIARILTYDLKDIHTVCYVRTRALGGAGMIVLACDEIVMTPEAKLGVGTPAVPAQDGTVRNIPEPERAKIESAMKAELRLLARLNGRDGALAESMVDAGEGVWLIRNIRSRELRYVRADEWRGQVRSGKENGPGGSEPAAEWELLRVLVRPGLELILTAREAVEAGFASGIIGSPPDRPLAGLMEHLRVVAEPKILPVGRWEVPTRPAATQGSAGLSPGAVRRSDADGQLLAPGFLPFVRLAAAGNCQLQVTPPGRVAPATRPAATQPLARRVEGGRVYIGELGWYPLPEVARPALPEKITKAFVIPIREPITSKTYDAVRRKAVRCLAGGAEIVIFHMNTPGGEGGAMRQIVRLIVEDLKKVYTVAYVDPEAFSAGAIISLACNEIAISPTGVIGDAMPILVGPGGMLTPMPQEERGKIESAIRAEVRVLAGKNGHSVALCEAMVTIDMEIWLIRNRQSRELQIVDRADWEGRVAGAPTSQPSAPPADTPWEFVKIVDGPRELVTLTAREAIEYDLAHYVFEDMAELEKHYDIVLPPEVLGDNWSERLVEFLLHPAVLGFLFFVALLCIYVEINTPGFGVAGTIAVVCFAVIFGSRYLTGLANWWEIALFVLGVLLLLVEIFVTPGFGVMGVLGGIFCAVALVAMLVPNAPGRLPYPDSPLDWSVLANGLLALTLGFLAAVAGAIVLARYLPKVPVAGRLVLAPPRVEARPPASEGAAILRVRPGQTGRVIQTCRPVGKVQIGQVLVDAVAEGAFLSAGTDVVVLRNDGNRVIVERKT